MTVTKHRAYQAGAVTALSTDLNSLANVTNSATFDLDNTSGLELLFDFELVLAAQGSSRSTGAYVALYFTQALDGSNYGDAHETTAIWVADFPLDAATTARRATRWGLELPPGLLRGFVRNVTGQTLAASGNTLKHRARSYETT